MKQLIRYLLVGLLNTAVGYGIIFILMYGFGVNPELSNAIGYLFGLVVSYTMNRRFTFESKEKRLKEFSKFLGVFAIAYSLNFITLVALIRWLHVEKGVSQILASVVYVGVSFVLSKYYTFAARTRTAS